MLSLAPNKRGPGNDRLVSALILAIVLSSSRQVRINRGSGSFGFTLSGNAPVFVRSVDRGGAAERVGLKSGDQLLQLNGINIR